jgi:hypothetical protein
MANQSCNPCKELRIRRTTQVFDNLVASRAKCQGIPATKIVRSMVLDIVSQYPEYMKEPKEAEVKETELSLYGIAGAAKKQIQHICEHIGVDTSSFLKVKLFDMLSKLPENNLIAD